MFGVAKRWIPVVIVIVVAVAAGLAAALGAAHINMRPVPAASTRSGMFSTRGLRPETVITSITWMPILGRMVVNARGPWSLPS